VTLPFIPSRLSVFRATGLKVQLAACDTFRAGAVEQLKTHAMRLGVRLGLPVSTRGRSCFLSALRGAACLETAATRCGR
jgi:hypothetical protein